MRIDLPVPLPVPTTPPTLPTPIPLFSSFFTGKLPPTTHLNPPPNPSPRNTSRNSHLFAKTTPGKNYPLASARTKTPTPGWIPIEPSRKSSPARLCPLTSLMRSADLRKHLHHTVSRKVHGERNNINKQNAEKSLVSVNFFRWCRKYGDEIPWQCSWPSSGELSVPFLPRKTPHFHVWCPHPDNPYPLN